ncbi:MAG: hypothetical protein RR614_15165, partial [Eubacterium sp.]
NTAVDEGDFPQIQKGTAAATTMKPGDIIVTGTGDSEKSQLFLGWTVEAPKTSGIAAKDTDFDKDSKITTALFGPEAFLQDVDNALAGKQTELTVYAQLRDVKVTFLDSSLKQGGDDPATADKPKQYGSAVNINADNTYTVPDMTADANKRPGYTCVGWAGEAKADFEPDATAESITAALVQNVGTGFDDKSPTTLYAVWQRSGFRAEFYKNQGTKDEKPMATCVVEYDKPIGALPELGDTEKLYVDAKGQKHQFKGWQYDDTAITAESTYGYTSDHNMTDKPMTIKGAYDDAFDLTFYSDTDQSSGVSATIENIVTGQSLTEAGKSLPSGPNKEG